MPPYSGRSALRHFACPNCPARASSPSWAGSSPWTNRRHRARTRHLTSTHCAAQSSSGHRPDASSFDAGLDDGAAFDDAPIPWRPIRERLRDYVAAELPIASRPIPRDTARVGATQNALTRVESRTLVEIDSGNLGPDGDDDPDQFLPWRSGGADSDNVPSLLARPYGAVAPQAGDLIEVSTDSWRVQLLAVCLGNFRGVDHFYTNTGKWFVSSGVRSLFSVTRFASAGELAPVIAALPTAARQEAGSGEAERDAIALDDMLNTLQDLKLGPSREAGSGLLKKMNAFAEQSAAIHMANAAVLDNAFQVLHQASTSPSASSLSSDSPSSLAPRRQTYMTLDELAAVLLRRQGHKLHGERHHHSNHRHSHPIRNLRGAGSGSEGKDEFTAPAMYAVYRATMTDELAFRPLTANLGNANETDENATAAGEKLHSHSRSCLFAVSSPEDIDTIREVEHVVRGFYDEPDRILLGGHLHDPSLKRSRLGAFIVKARRTIDRSRKTRTWWPYGMLAPVSASVSETWSLEPPPVEKWTASDVRILQFMHLWASFQRFSSSSRLHWIGSSILRAIERYDESEYLTMSTGWTFLQEVGWVTPWDIPARYSMGLPDVPPLRTGGLERSLDLPPPLSSPLLLSEDIFAGKRKDYGNLTAYCIDAPGAADIDDGIALERITDNLDEFWIHVHVADPASCIPPSSPLAEQAARLPQTAYLPGHYARMFPDDVVRERFSLAPDRPCLTFSARVNRQGAVLDSKITPAQLGRVIFITPDEVSAVVAGAEEKAMRDCNMAAMAEPSALDLPWATASFSVGTPPEADDVIASTPARRMTTADELAPDQRADLETLSSLATALRAIRLSNGAMPLYWPRPSVKVSRDSTTISVVDAAMANGPGSGSTLSDSASSTDDVSSFLQCAGDPYIRVWYEGAGEATSSSAAGSRLVESTMRLAGEVAADWCHERGIAVPFRGQPDAARHIDRLRTLTREDIYPALVLGKRPSEAALRELRRLLGADDVSAVSVPHVTMGVARYTKATSPLRRYADLLVHWQIEGALRAEMGARPVASENDVPTTPSPLVGPPFSRSQMERDILPLLRVRERALRTLDNRAGHDQWMLQALVRAWMGEQAGEGSSAPSQEVFSNLHFTVSRVDPRRGLVAGRLNWFERSALMEVGGLNPTAPSQGSGIQHLLLNDVRPGQVYPVALAHVDVHGNRVLVRRVGNCL